MFKSALKSPKTTNDELSSLTNKPSQQLRPSTTNPMSKSMTLTNNDSPQIINSDLSNDSLQTKTSMSTSLYSPSIPANNNNEQKDINNSAESISSTTPQVLIRANKVAMGTRVFPVIDPSGDAPPIKLRHFQPEKKGRFT